MKFSPTLLFLLLAIFCLNSAASGQPEYKCVKWWSSCRFRPVGRCAIWVKRRRCRRQCGRRFRPRWMRWRPWRRCYWTCRPKWVRRNRPGFQCPLGPVDDPDEQPVPDPSPKPCAQRCYRWWRAASRLGCDLSKCLIRRCSFRTFRGLRPGWKCIPMRTATPSAMAVSRIAISSAEEPQKKVFGAYYN